MTVPTEPLSLTLEHTYAATPERVYRAWTDPAELALWYAPSPEMPVEATVDLRVGGGYRVAMGPHVVTGVYREIVPHRRLVFTWQWQTQGSGAEMLVTIELEPNHGGGTRLTLRHDRLPTQEDRASHEQGWTSMIGRLEHVLAGAPDR